jgi:hypothetical protein
LRPLRRELLQVCLGLRDVEAALTCAYDCHLSSGRSDHIALIVPAGVTWSLLFRRALPGWLALTGSHSWSRSHRR